MLVRALRLLIVAGLAMGALSCVPGVARAATGPAVTGVSPSTGPVAGGTTVTITGTGFTGATGVDFGSAAVPASSFTVDSTGTSITATAPATAVAGPAVDVTVTTPAGTSATSPADQYLYADEFSYPPAGAGGVSRPFGIGVGAKDQNGTLIDIPYYVKPGNDYSLTSENDGSGLDVYRESLLTLAGHQPKEEWPLYLGSGPLVNTFIGDSSCNSEPWPWHTMSDPIDPNCWQIGVNAATSLIPANWDNWVPTTITDASGQTLVFDHWSAAGTPAPDTSHCDTGDLGYVQNWPGAGSYATEAGTPGAFAAGEQFNGWGDGGGIYANYALRSAGTTGPLIELASPFDCQWYQQNQPVAPEFACIDLDGSGVKSCTATGGVTADGKLDTSTLGLHTLTVTATDNNGSTRTLTRRYFVAQPPTMTITADPSTPSSTGWYNASQLGAGNALPVKVAISPSPNTDSIDTASCTLDGSSTPIWSFDSEQNNPNSPVVIPPTFSDPGTQTIQVPNGTHTLSCTTTDLSGQTTTQSATYKVDTNPPPQAQFQNPALPWYGPPTCPANDPINPGPATYEAGTQQSIQWWVSGDDGTDGSGIVSPATTSGSTTLPTSKIGSNVASAPDTVDAAGNVTPGQPCAYNVVDTIPPADAPAVTGTQGSNGWYTSDVTVHWNWTDAGGVDPSNCTQTSTSSGEGSSLMVMASCTDLSGNKAIDALPFNVDKTPPAVSVTGVQNGARYIAGAVPAAGCTTTDATSGVAASATVSVTPAGAGVGSYTATCSGAVDKAGNTAAPVSVSYTVAYGFGGFKAPLPGSTVKSNPGSALPVKFTLTTSNGTPISASLAATLASNLKVTLAGQGITPVTAGCSWNKSTSMFECPVKLPALSKMGSSYPYTITAYESVPGAQVRVPSWTTATADQNPETIYFK